MISDVILAICISHNVVNFLIRQRRFKSLHLTYFYVLSSIIIFLRMAWFSLILVVTTEWLNIDSHVKHAVEITDAVATYGELLLGI